MGKGLNSCKRTNQEYGVCLPAPKSATERQAQIFGGGIHLVFIWETITGLLL